jgi:hypothetical protein
MSCRDAFFLLVLLLLLISAVHIIADVGYYRRCWLLPLFPLFPLLSLLSLMPIIALVRRLLSEFDAAGHADALEIILLLSSDVIAADVELDQRPVVA